MIFLFNYKEKGFTLIETLVAIAVFIIIAVSVTNSYTKVMELVHLSRVKNTATALANEQFEIIRNLPYSDVGISGGIPSGKIKHIQTLTRDNIDFEVETTIRNIDDSFDGTINGNPNDTSPSDYKLVAVKVSCTLCKNFKALSFTTHVAPLNLETASTNGALFVQVFDAVGLPIQGVNIHIENNKENPAIIIDDTTDINGFLQIVDAPPGIDAYEITVSKSGYSQEKTYLPGDISNPNPINSHATVALQQLTEMSFSIDRLSTINVETISKTCSPIGSINFSVQGSKLIGTNPDVLKYDSNYVTNSTTGQFTDSNIEWDSYNILLNDSVYDLSGSIPLNPIILNPDSTQDIKLIVDRKNPDSLLVTVKDAGTQLPLTGASVNIQQASFSVNDTFITGQGFLQQNDWSGGAGQSDFINETKYFYSDGNIDTSNPAGELKLLNISGVYMSSGYLVSSTFDTGSISNFYQLLWQPQSQPTQTGADSVKLQIATNNDNATWNFVGPDGTAGTFYIPSTPNISSIHNGDRYFRYKIYLNTLDTAYTPNIGEISFTFSSSCVPPGQVFFTGLRAADYDITVSKSGYNDYGETITISDSVPWLEKEVFLTP